MARKYLIFFLSICSTDLYISANSCQNGDTVTGSGVNAGEIDVILKKHNNLRKLITAGEVPGQPKGKNLETLVWDEALAREAQVIADTCVYAHVDVQDDRWYVGQNLYRQKSTEMSSESHWDVGIQKWFDEYKLFEYNVFGCSQGTGHYTQVVWATTKYVGCGYTAYEANEKMKYQKLYVCNYGPGGNMVGDVPYDLA